MADPLASGSLVGPAPGSGSPRAAPAPRAGRRGLRSRAARAAAPGPCPPRFSSNGPGCAVVCSLYARLFGDDHDRRRAPVDLLRSAARRPRCTVLAFLARSLEKSRRMRSGAASRRPTSSPLSAGPRTSSRTSRSFASCTSPATSATRANASSRLPRELDDAGVELADVAELGDDRDQPGARFRGLVDHLPLAIAQRRRCRVCSIRR